MQRYLVVAAIVIAVWLIVGLCGKAVLSVDNVPAAAPSDWRK